MRPYLRVRAAPGLFMLLAVLAATEVAALDGDRRVEQYAHTSWRSRDGLPQDAVLAVAQTPDGYQWIGTAAGLARFDGVRFEVFDRANVPEMANHFILDLAVDPDGDLWIATNGGGLLRYRGGVFRRYAEADGLPHGRILCLLPSADGLWAGTYGGGLVHLGRDDRIEVLGLAEGLPDLSIFALARTADGALWIGSQNGGLSRLDGEGIRTWTSADGLPSSFVRALHVDRRGGLWIGTTEGLARIDGERLADPVLGAVWTIADGLPHPTVLALADDRDDNLWIGTYGGGLARLRNGRFEVLGPDGGLLYGTVRDLLEDRQGRLWIATGLGLDRLADGAVTSYPDSAINSFFHAADGTLWLATFDSLVHLGSDGVVRRRWRAADGLAGTPVRHVAPDADGAVWIATAGGLQRLADGRLSTWSEADGLPSRSIFHLLPRADGSLLLGTGGGIALWRDGEVRRTLSQADGLVDNNVRTLFEDRSGCLWVGTTNGLSRIDGLNRIDDLSKGDIAITNFTRRDGLTSDSIGSLLETAEGDLWITTNGGGLNRLRGDDLAAVTVLDGLPDETLCHLSFDPRGVAWIFSTKGVVRVPAGALEGVADGRAERLEERLIDSADGFANAMCSTFGQLTPWSRDGRLWIGTYGGIAVLDPARLERKASRPSAVLEIVRVDGRERTASPRLEIPPESRSIEIHYTVLGARDAVTARFRYRLAGWHDDWTDADTRRVAFFTHPPPGRYRFEFEARDIGGDWNPGPRLEIVVRAAWYQSLAFRMIAVLAMAGLGWALHRFIHLERYSRTLDRLRERILRQNEELEQKNAELEGIALNVSRDLRSPLFTIQGFLGLLERDLRRGDARRLDRDLEQIRAAVLELDGDVEAMLAQSPREADPSIDGPA